VAVIKILTVILAQIFIGSILKYGIFLFEALICFTSGMDNFLTKHFCEAFLLVGKM
jgi:hypothetical protein